MPGSPVTTTIPPAEAILASSSRRPTSGMLRLGAGRGGEPGPERWRPADAPARLLHRRPRLRAQLALEELPAVLVLPHAPRGSGRAARRGGSGRRGPRPRRGRRRCGGGRGRRRVRWRRGRCVSSARIATWAWRRRSRSAMHHCWKRKQAGRSRPSTNWPRNSDAHSSRVSVVAVRGAHSRSRSTRAPSGADLDVLAAGDEVRREGGAQLGQRPAELRARIVRPFPQEIAEPLAQVGPARGHEVGDESACLLRGRKRHALPVANDVQLAEKTDLEHGACADSKPPTVPRFEHQVERRGRRPPERGEAATGGHLAQPRLTRLRAEGQADFLRARGRRADHRGGRSNRRGRRG